MVPRLSGSSRHRRGGSSRHLKFLQTRAHPAVIVLVSRASMTETQCPYATDFGHSDNTMNNIKLGKSASSAKPGEALLTSLKARFEKNMNRHNSLDWAKVNAKLEAHPEKLASLNEMERTGGEPDVVGQDKESGEYIFFDCSEQTPSGRVSLCYDREALDSRKENKPKDNAIEMATAMGVEILTEKEYFELQKMGDFDTKRSSWLRTPDDIRMLGGAIYGERRYGRVFVGCNGAESYYQGRGFRGSVKV